MASNLGLKAVDCKGQSLPIAMDLSHRLGEGATAFIYKVRLQGQLYAAKIYKPGRVFSSQKLEAMLVAPPAGVIATEGSRTFIQYTWVSYLVKDDSNKVIGFLMPYVDQQDTYSLDTYYDPVLSKRLTGTHLGALSLRLEIALNLCRLIDQLHNCGHHFIDIKPQNIRVYKQNHRVVLMDCDGFSIRNENGQPPRFPADLISTDFIAPEVSRHHLSPRSLGEGQDRYALAVILFQLLNNGTHPFQGIVIERSIQVSTNDERAALWLYPHGLVPHPDVKPRPQSIHELFLPESRALFDRAFTSVTRPSPHEWANHLQSILENRLLVRCQYFPDNLGHIHFSGRACIGCAIEQQRTATPNHPAQTSTSHDGQLAGASGAGPGAKSSATNSSAPLGSIGSASWSWNNPKHQYKLAAWFMVLVAAFVASLILLNRDHNKALDQPTVSPLNVQLKSGETQGIRISQIYGDTLLNGIHIYVPQGATKLDVRLDSPSSVDLDLFVRSGSDVEWGPNGLAYDFFSAQSPFANEVITIKFGSCAPPAACDSVREGNYYIALKVVGLLKSDIYARITAEVTGGSYVESSTLSNDKPPRDTGLDSTRKEDYWVNPDDGLTYVRIPAGRFRMGCSPGDGECYGDEHPGADVEIEKEFWIGQAEVSQGAYERVMENNPSKFRGAASPVEGVTWHEAAEYCGKVGLRLPTEEEWEYAARGGKARARYGELEEIAWYDGNSGGRTRTAQKKKANGYGLYDMLGNVWEWTASAYDGSTKTLRGGAWDDVPSVVRVSIRFRSAPGLRSNSAGFRCVGD